MHDAVWNLEYRGDGDYDKNDLFQGSNETRLIQKLICDKLFDKQCKKIEHCLQVTFHIIGI